MDDKSPDQGRDQQQDGFTSTEWSQHNNNTQHHLPPSTSVLSGTHISQHLSSHQSTSHGEGSSYVQTEIYSLLNFENGLTLDKTVAMFGNTSEY